VPRLVGPGTRTQNKQSIGTPGSFFVPANHRHVTTIVARHCSLTVVALRLAAFGDVMTIDLRKTRRSLPDHHRHRLVVVVVVVVVGGGYNVTASWFPDVQTPDF
jgi:hypothetical protein